MNKLARFTAFDRGAKATARRLGSVRRSEALYFAFLSYSHKDKALADWLHDQIEQYRVPGSLVGQLTDHGIIPKRLSPIFRDQHELAAAHDLGEEIQQALVNSRFLIVLCSPHAARSRWTNAEIETFKRHRPDGCVLAAIASGEPFASEIPGRETDECFPPALRQKYDRRGRPTAKRAEPLAADLRGEGEERRLGLLKLIAGMLGVGLDDLVQRDAKRRQRRLAFLAAISLGGMAVTSGLAITAVHARDAAREQRREAEGLVSFMLGDLKDKLEPIGRLDALDGVGSRVLAYYSKQDASELPDASLLQRSRALSLMGQVAFSRGELDQAEQLYREASTGTAEAVRRNAADPQRLYDHAQNVFYLGYIAAQRGQMDGAEAGMREYKRLATGMVALQPDNMKWRMESEDADANLGIVLYERRRFGEAASQLKQALQTVQALTTANPGNSDYQKSLVETLAWLADAELSNGEVGTASRHRQQQVALLSRLSSAPASDVSYRQQLIAARLKLGQLMGAQGELGTAEESARSALALAQNLIAQEPDNAVWVDFAAAAELQLAQLLLNSGRRVEAVVHADAGCELVKRLFSRGGAVAGWRIDQGNCYATRAQLALAAGELPMARQLASKAISSAGKLQSGDPVDDKFTLAMFQRLRGDIDLQGGNAAAARAAWSAALSALPATAPETPRESAIRADLLSRLGNVSASRTIRGHLAGMGIRHADLLG